MTSETSCAVEAVVSPVNGTPIRLVLPYPISANRYWTQFRLGDRLMQAPSKEAKAFKLQVGWLAKAAGIRKPLTGRVRVDIELYPQRPQDWARRAQRNPSTWDDDVRCLDLDNANKVLLDAFKGVVIDDDKWVRELHSRRVEPDGEARVVVTITQLALPAVPQGSLL